MASSKNSDSLERVKFRRKAALVGTACVLAALVAYGVLRPDPEDAKINEIKGMILDRKSGRMSREDRDTMRDLMNKLSPETRQRVGKEIMRAMLQKFRDDTAGMSMDDKKRKIDEAVNKMRKRFVNMSDEKRVKMRERMDSTESKKRMKVALGFYYSDFSPEERNLMDPLVQEWTIEMSVLEKGRRNR